MRTLCWSRGQDVTGKLTSIHSLPYRYDDPRQFARQSYSFVYIFVATENADKTTTKSDTNTLHLTCYMLHDMTSFTALNDVLTTYQ